MSSMIASVSSSMRSDAGMPLPTSASTPTAKAMSVAVGMAQPWRVTGSVLTAMYSRAGTMTPPAAAMIGSSATFGSASAPLCISRRISSPTTRKNTVISPSFTQKCRSCAGRNRDIPEPKRQVPQRLVVGGEAGCSPR